MAGRGLGAFLNGAMNGYNFVTDAQNNKADRDRRAKMDAIADRQLQRGNQRQDANDAYVAEDRAYQRGERARVAEDRDFIRGVYADGAARADDALAADRDAEGRGGNIISDIVTGGGGEDQLTGQGDANMSIVGDGGGASIVGDRATPENTERMHAYQGDPNDVQRSRIQPAPSRRGAPQLAPPRSTSPDAPDMTEATKPARNLPQESEAVAADTIKVLAETATPSGAAMADVITDQPRTPRPTRATADRVAKSWMDYYEAEGMPFIAEQLTRRGMIAEARQFDAWSREASTRRGMEAYGRAAYYASQGDFDNFGKSVTELYNSSGYFDDDMTIVPEQSEFMRDEAGNIDGARIVLRTSDGEEFVQQWETLDEMVEETLNMFAPERAFELHLERQNQAVDVRAAAHDRAIEREDWLWKKMVESNLKGDEQERVAKVAKELAGDITLGWSDMSQDEKLALIIERIQLEDAAAGSMAGSAAPPGAQQNVPEVMRRP